MKVDNRIPFKIILNVKNDEIKDITPSVNAIYLSNNSYMIYYKNGKSYHHKINDIIFSNNDPKLLNCSSVYVNEKNISIFEKVLYYNDLKIIKIIINNNKYILEYKNKCKIYQSIITDNSIPKNVLNYYIEIAKYLDSKNTNDNDLFSWSKQFSKIGSLDEQSILGKYLLKEKNNYLNKLLWFICQVLKVDNLIKINKTKRYKEENQFPPYLLTIIF